MRIDWTRLERIAVWAVTAAIALYLGLRPPAPPEFVIEAPAGVAVEARGLPVKVTRTR